MSFLKGSIPLTVYKASQELLANITSDRLRQFAFQPIDEIAEEKNWGFVNHDDMFDTEWVKSVPEKGQYVVFGFRIDSRKIPASILKKHIAAMMADELEAMEAQGKKFISRQRKAEIRELCKARLLSKQEPQPSMFGVCADPALGLIYVANKSKGSLAVFEDYMESAFGERLTPLCSDFMENSVGSMAIENFMADLLTGGKSVTVNGQHYSVDELGTVTLNDFEKKASVSVQDAPDSVKTSLQAGMRPSSLAIQITTPDEEEIRFTLNTMFTFTGLKTPRIPKADKDADLDAEFLIKMGYIETAMLVLTSLLTDSGESA